MGRGYPEGPPRVRAVMKDERIVAWRVSDRKVKASLQARRVIKKSVNYIQTNVKSSGRFRR